MMKSKAQSIQQLLYAYKKMEKFGFQPQKVGLLEKVEAKFLVQVIMEQLFN